MNLGGISIYGGVCAKVEGVGLKCSPKKISPLSGSSLTMIGLNVVV